jgi:hypothetical protein
MKYIKTILLSGLIAGALDGTAAILFYAKPINLHNTSLIFRYIASGVFGQTAYTTGPFYPITGLVLHFTIATIWSAIYLFIFYPVFKPGGVWAKAILVGALVWIGMNGLVMPLAGFAAKYSGWAILRSYLILVFCVGLPISLVVEKRR